MKINATDLTQSGKPGMTLIEITVVILVILTLVSVMFIGANIYKQSTNRANCILTISHIHQSVRVNQNLNDRQPLVDALEWDDIIGEDKFIVTMPRCPKNSGRYLLEDYYPAISVVAVVCQTDGKNGTDSAGPRDHFPSHVRGW